MYTVLFVSANKGEWVNERPNPRDGFCYAWVYNADAPMLSELGGVLVCSANGGICRAGEYQHPIPLATLGKGLSIS